MLRRLQFAGAVLLLATEIDGQLAAYLFQPAPSSFWGVQKAHSRARLLSPANASDAGPAWLMLLS
jgi:hypothetical protein